jgi:lipoprotein-releasing system permease protein
MLVIKKTKEIGILKSMGATGASIMRIFVLEGLILGAIGTALGVAGGLFLSYLIDRYRFITIPGEVYFLDTLPVRMEIRDFVIVAAASMIISLLATIYPAFRASRLVPVEAIRYE